jgi:hypothetical protein
MHGIHSRTRDTRKTMEYNCPRVSLFGRNPGSHLFPYNPVRDSIVLRLLARASSIPLSCRLWDPSAAWIAFGVETMVSKNIPSGLCKVDLS